MIEQNEDLFLKVLEGLHQNGSIRELVLVGSWCQLLYREYCNNTPLIPAVRTTDLDLLVPKPHKENQKFNISNMLQEMGFEMEYSSNSNYKKHRFGVFSVEFLVPLKGKGEMLIERTLGLSL